jgi:hypothetical protein
MMPSLRERGEDIPILVEIAMQEKLGRKYEPSRGTPLNCYRLNRSTLHFRMKKLGIAGSIDAKLEFQSVPVIRQREELESGQL